MKTSTTKKYFILTAFILASFFVEAQNTSITGSASANTFYAPSWFRSTGISGWFNQTYGVGIVATDTYWVRATDGTGATNRGFAAATLYASGTVYANTISVPSWFRSTGISGWYNETYGVGIYANDGYWIRAGNGDGVSTNRGFAAGQLFSYGDTTVGGNLTVAGTILTARVKVAVAYGANWNWADYVFANDYKLKPLHEVEAYINTNNHLEGIPTTEEVKKDGIDVAPVTAKLLEKIEELTLYMIEIKKQNDAQQNEIETLKNNFKDFKKI